MAKKYAMIGNTAVQIKKRYAMIGSTATPVKREYAMIGETANLVFTADSLLLSVRENTSTLKTESIKLIGDE